MTTTVLTATGYGRPVGVRLRTVDEAAVRAVLPWWWVDEPVEPELTWDVEDPRTARGTIHAVELWVAEHAVAHVFVHAAVVEYGGRALVLPGRSMAGKTTLTAALLQRGARFCSDEYAVLDLDGAVHPYPRPLSVRHDDGRADVPPDTFGAATVAGPVPVAAVALTRYVPGASWSPAPLSPAAAVLQVLDNTVGARTAPARALTAVTAALAGATAVIGERGPAEDAVEALLALLDGG